VSCSLFFFSSRRRHTRSTRDWSSDVCSSDLYSYDALDHLSQVTDAQANLTSYGYKTPDCACSTGYDLVSFRDASGRTLAHDYDRSEERRVGKERRSRWSTKHENKKPAQRTQN